VSDMVRAVARSTRRGRTAGREGEPRMITDTGYGRSGSVPPVRVSSPTEERNPRTRDIDIVPTAEDLWALFETVL
jgi:hypothetical protein